jgi:hypothetical protein
MMMTFIDIDPVVLKLSKSRLLGSFCLKPIGPVHGGFNFSEGTSAKWIFDVEIEK